MSVPCAGHPRLALQCFKSVYGRDKPGQDDGEASVPTSTLATCAAPVQCAFSSSVFTRFTHEEQGLNCTRRRSAKVLEFAAPSWSHTGQIARRPRSSGASSGSQPMARRFSASYLEEPVSSLATWARNLAVLAVVAAVVSI